MHYDARLRRNEENGKSGGEKRSFRIRDEKIAPERKNILELAEIDRRRHAASVIYTTSSSAIIYVIGCVNLRPSPCVKAEHPTVHIMTQSVPMEENHPSNKNRMQIL